MGKFYIMGVSPNPIQGGFPLRSRWSLPPFIKQVTEYQPYNFGSFSLFGDSLIIKGRAIFKKLTVRNFYRFCIMPVLLAGIRLVSRIQAAINCRNLSYLSCPKFKLISQRIRFPRPSKVFQLQTRHMAIKLAAEKDKIKAAFNYLRGIKRPSVASPWLSPEEAWLLPALDCKSFSILMLELLKSLGIKSELWVGLSNREKNGHAWLAVNIKGEKSVIDRNYRKAVSLDEYMRRHPYSLVKRIA